MSNAACEIRTVKKERVFYFDVLRVIACLSVILFHVSGNYISTGLKDLTFFNNVDYWICNVFYSVSRLGVPLFTMISGALMLDGNYSFSREKLIKHIVKIAVFYVFWFVVYAVFFKIALPIFHKESVSVKEVFSVADNDAYHLWFCPMIIGLYLITPLLRLWVKPDNKKYVKYFLALSLIFFIVIDNTFRVADLFIDVTIVKNIVNHVELRYVFGYTFYFVLGWYLNNFDIKNKTALIVLTVIGFLMTYFTKFIISTLLNSVASVQNDFTPNVVIMAIFVFSVCKKIASKENDKLYLCNKALSFVAKHSLGIYGVHQIMIYLFMAITAKLGLSFVSLETVIVFVFASIFSLLISFAFAKIPLLKKVV